jgi:pantetheine-phosphate adenylyltransferase
MKIAVFPGSFDPITRGHESIVNRACTLFDTIYIAIGINANKSNLFSLDKRTKYIEETFKNNPKIKVVSYQELTVKLCRDLGAKFILRGLRNTSDLNYEFPISHANRLLDPAIETVFFITDPGFSAINSSIVRDIYKHGGDIKAFIPDAVEL